MGYNLLMNGVYWGYNPLTKHLLTSWDIQVQITWFNVKNIHRFPKDLSQIKFIAVSIRGPSEANPASIRELSES